MLSRICRVVLSGFLVLALLLEPVVAQLSTDSHVGPTASATVDRALIPVGGSVTVDASASRTSTGSTRNLEYRWHFGELGETFTDWTRRTTATKTYTDDGFAQIRLQVRDENGFIDETTLSVTVRRFEGDRTPWAKFDVTPKSGDTSTLFTFTVQPFSAIGTATREMEVRWDWNRDGVADTEWTTSRTATHTFSQTGLREVWVEVRDPVADVVGVEKGYYVIGEEDDNRRNREIGRIQVSRSDRPRASFRTFPTTGGEVGQTIRFDAVDTQRASTYRWDFNGDGTYDTAWLPYEAVEYTFGEAATYTVTLEARNDKNEIDRTTRDIVIEPADIGPVAKLTVRNTASPSSPTFGLISELFTLNASGSRDEDGRSSDLRYRFDFEGDGRFDTAFITSSRAEHRYQRTGEYRVVVEVQDLQGLTSQADAFVTIVTNTPPTAQLAARPTATLVGEEVRFTATATDGQSRSSDLRYRFDFDGNGVYDTEWERSKTMRYTYDRAGTFAATVEVRDAGNAITRASLPIQIVASAAPVVSLSIAPRVGVTAENVIFDATGTVDPTGMAGPLKYRWNFDALDRQDITFDTGWTSRPTATRRYREPGEYLVHLAVKNTAGETTSRWGNVTISTASDDMAYLVRKRVFDRYEPASLLTRAEFAVMLSQATGQRLTQPEVQPFPDVSREDDFAAAAVLAVERDWLQLRDDFDFDPDAPVTRMELAEAVVSALFPGVPSETTRAHYVDISPSSQLNRTARVLHTYDLVPGTILRPDARATRAEASTMIAGLLRQYDRGGSFTTASILDALFSFIR